MNQYHIPEIDLVIVDLYPFEETVQMVSKEDISEKEKENRIIEKSISADHP